MNAKEESYMYVHGHETCKGLMTNLSIRKDCGVVALKATLDEPLRAVGVDCFLLSVHIEDIIKGEGLVLTQDHLGLSWHHIRTDVTAFNPLFGQLRTDPGRQKETKRNISKFPPQER